MRSNGWVRDYRWQYGLSSRQNYLFSLVGRFEPPIAAGVQAHLGPMGGVSVRVENGELVITSSGEDAVDSLQYAADRVVEIAEQLEDSVRISWTERPPVGDAGPAERIDGYWIPSEYVTTYRHRRQRAFEALAACASDVEQWKMEEHDGLIVAAAHGGDDVRTFYLGISQLEMIEEALAEGTLPDYVR